MPYQSLVDARKQPLPFLTWVADRPKAAFLPPTYFQLLETFYALTRMYGLQLHEAHTQRNAFMEIAGLGGVWISAPRLYLACWERPVFACFDWYVWTQGVQGVDRDVSTP